MKITELTYSYGRTKQVEQFNPINIHASIKAEISDGEDVASVYQLLKQKVIEKVNADVEQAVEALRSPQPKQRATRTPNKFKGISEQGPGFNLPKDNVLTMDELADLYKERTGHSARIKPMDAIYDWALTQEDIIETKDGLIINK